MARYSDDTNIQCPFYLRQTETKIICEGCIEGTHMLTAFPSEKQKKAHEKAFCYLMDGGRCPFAMMLFRKYEEEPVK